MTPRRPTRDDPRERHGSSSASSSDSGAAGRAGVIVKGLAALLFTLGFIAGVPYLLIRIGAFPTSIPDPSTLWRAAIGPDLTGHGVFVVLAALVWVGWAWFTLSVLRETGAAIRSRGRRPTRAPRRVVGTNLPRRAAGRHPGRRHRGHVRVRPAAGGRCPSCGRRRPLRGRPGDRARHRRHRHPQRGQRRNVRAGHLLERGGVSVDESRRRRIRAPGPPPRRPPRKSAGKQGRAAATTNYTVRRYDTLWTIAEKQLGDPTRYREIVNLNPHLQHDTTIHAGETLKLPQHHTQQSRRPAVTTGTAPRAGVAPPGARGASDGAAGRHRLRDRR